MEEDGLRGHLGYLHSVPQTALKWLMLLSVPESQTHVCSIKYKNFLRLIEKLEDPLIDTDF